MDTLISFPLLGGGTFNLPRSISIFGFEIYIYGLIIALGYGLAALYLYRRRDAFGLKSENVLDIIMCAVLAGIVGARLYYVAFAWKDEFAGKGFLNLINVRQGGLAIYGGLLGSTLAVFIYTRIKKINFLRTLDAVAVPVMIGQAIGRWGNLFNREAYGSETTLPWRMGLHYPSGAEIYVHPTFLYDSLWNIIGAVALHIYAKRAKLRPNGQLFLLYVLWYGLGRVWIEGLRTDSLMLGSLRVSQLLAGVCIVGAACALVFLKLRKIPEIATVGNRSENSEEHSDEDSDE
ncbi:MAG: prolipoprotein diacylglyceryl transferase [Oscillospiraceae bacterium]|jgi:phosphatidylglycerol:prolipoprotein diacylglycerol transferase|nr:prolipoprotein diacylglyceryl transferase [Oscillospiraceae bacterium]